MFSGKAQDRRALRLSAYAPAPGTRFPESASGACFAGPCSPWSPPFAPPPPPPVARLCSGTSPVLRGGPTSQVRSSSAIALGLPDATRGACRHGQTWDLPVPMRGASVRAQGLTTARGSDASRDNDAAVVAFRLLARRRLPGVAFLRGSIPGPHVPLSTLRLDPYGPTRMTRSWCESLALHHLELSSMNTSLVLTGASQDKGPATRSGYLGQSKRERLLLFEMSISHASGKRADPFVIPGSTWLFSAVSVTAHRR